MNAIYLLMFCCGILSVTSLVAQESLEGLPVPQDWIDAKTSHRVVRLSELPGSVSLYFHQQGYTPEGDKLLIFTPRGLETVDLNNHELQLVVPRRQYSGGGSSGVEMVRRTRHVYAVRVEREAEPKDEE